MPLAAKRLVVTAGDLGLAPEIDDGIMRAVRAGVVSAVGVLVNGRRPTRIRPLAKAGVTLGLELNLTEGSPVSRRKSVRSLIDPDTGLLWDSGRSAGAADPEAIHREFRAQWRRAEMIFDPLWVATHHHVALQPPVFEAALALAEEKGVGLRALDDDQRDRVRDAGLWCPDRVEAGFYEEPGIAVPGLLAILDGLEQGTTELLCLPGNLAKDLVGAHPYVWQRTVELSTLTNARVGARLADESDPIELVGYGGLPLET